MNILGNEKWTILKEPRGIVNKYLISDKGRIFSTIKNRLLRGADHCQGYIHVTLKHIDGKYRKHLVHRLVAMNFIDGYSEDKPFVNHKDGNKINNSADNLEWVSHQENVEHSVKTGLNKSGELFKTKYKGEDNPNNRYSDAVVHRICHLLSTGVKPDDIVDIIQKENNNVFSNRALEKYVKTKIRSRLCRIDISNNYTW